MFQNIQLHTQSCKDVELVWLQNSRPWHSNVPWSLARLKPRRRAEVRVASVHEVVCSSNLLQRGDTEEIYHSWDRQYISQLSQNLQELNPKI